LGSQAYGIHVGRAAIGAEFPAQLCKIGRLLIALLLIADPGGRVCHLQEATGRRPIDVSS
jgi:hypothetical protein